MVSQINYSSIDATYPIAGKDNDSQGFRDNFGYIQAGLEIAQGEITALQNSSASTADDNNFNNNQISGAVFRNNSDLYFDAGTVGDNNTTLISYENGPYQKLIIDNPTTLSLSFPNTASQVYKMRIELWGVDTPYSVGFAGTNANIITNNISNPVYIKNSLLSRSFDIWTFDAGDNIYIYDVGNHNSFYENVEGSVINYSSGEYQKFTINAATNFTVGGFPPFGTLGRIRVEIFADNNPRTLTFTAQNNDPTPTSGVIKKNFTTPLSVTSSANPTVYEFWSHDGGNTVFMSSLGIFT